MNVSCKSVEDITIYKIGMSRDIICLIHYITKKIHPSKSPTSELFQSDPCPLVCKIKHLGREYIPLRSSMYSSTLSLLNATNSIVCVCKNLQHSPKQNAEDMCREFHLYLAHLCVMVLMLAVLMLRM
ncbi:hypothetical protein CHARACLAT_029344 [Characodon lateralis]|uniref:Uncharacterized protein n=1 Tax=Characodon lateralis TaxID=208331 RepID=A0ABU7EPE9_9TELE|nr:hypothetical protein [Characodon lateralis]